MTTTEIDHANRLAEAERAFSASATQSGEPNLFEGWTERAAELEAIKNAQLWKAKGIALRAAIDELKFHDSELARLSVEIPAAKAELDTVEQHPTIARWKKARAIAMSTLDAFGQWERYAQWVVAKGVGSRQRIGDNQVPSANWPAEILFDEAAEQKAIARYRELQGAQVHLEQERSAANSRKTTLLANHPELEVLTRPS